MISLFILGLFLLTVIWNAYYAAHWNRDLSVFLYFLQDHVYAGDQAQMTEQIENRKRLMLSVLEVSFHVDKRLAFQDCENTSVSDFVYKRDIFALLGHQRIIRTLDINCTKRGCYRIDESYLTAFSMLHTRRFSAAHPAAAQLYVYAARVDVSDILVACERLMGSIQCAKRLYEDPFAFSSIREYTVTDPMNTINWKASAKTGELMVNTFESTLTEKVMIYLDLEDNMILKYEALIEDSISVAASLAQRLIVRGMEVGICINADTHAPAYADEHVTHTDTDIRISGDKRSAEASGITVLAPAGGKKQLERIERTLAGYESGGKVMPFASLLSTDLLSVRAGARRQPLQQSASGSAEDCVMIFISKNAVQNQPVIENLAGKGQQAIWVIPYMKNEVCSIQTPGNIHLIKREVERS